MSQTEFIMLLIVGIIGILIVLEINSRKKLRADVRYKWGKLPYQVRFDKEESLKEAWQTEKKFRTWDSEVDDLTWYDLDMFEVFETVNHTYSSVGSEALYQRLRNFDFGQDQRLEKLITFYQENPKLREEIQYQFARLGKKDRNFAKQYLADGKSKRIGHIGLFAFLGMLPLIGLGLFLLGQVIGIYIAIISVLFNTVYYLIKKQTLETELNSMSYLVSTISAAKKIATFATPLQAELQKNVQPLKEIPKFGFSFRVKNGSEAELFFDYFNMMFMLPFISYHFVISRLEKKTEQAIQLWQLLGELEVAAAVLNYRTYMPYSCQPVFAEGGIMAEDTYHPLIAEAVVNPIDWQQNTLVTGSNASGKSTYVKSIAINCILAQTIQTTLAESFTIQPGHVLTSMAIEDNLFEGDSYFVSEIKSIKRLLQQVETKERCYCFVDEILKGTNTIERIASSAAIVNWLSDYPSLAFVATHDIELTEILKKDCANVHFEEQVTPEKGISFDFKLKQGPAKTRNAIALLDVLKYPTAIVKEAQAEAAFFDQHRQWRVVE
ncbi:MutS-related protein [Enterococcus mundtii]|uniref:DNA mismatch repair protein n=1 Tax=Enterococcus mundtii TaxID=53346 RepID=A0A1L8V0T0_ENTMU|nr:DNA mismatch repair protein MutS [Enterococcus mundtii]GEN17819.1 DNA mismatch repair protein MutS [Ligilactobacillus acidipiscis]AUB53927.1 DNA mismatch repair protein MutS [Enterococcus mundtii]MZZ59104.1 DNA mismatch repair protein MutS [Enterococcus mundtii]MZZ62102.1 DNA mismatch repair protein MutS [Enterococcus mundtii]MZZ69182.1 DNA mismatch repair protein MutS [Enterococcus mundtii]